MTKVMVVEDDQSLREIYSIRLTAEGYEIVSAGDGEEALALAVKEKPDLILSDVMMPKISGFDMLDILRQTPETKGIKVIMMTALSSDDQRKRGEGLGADKYLVKSQVGIEDVIAAVHETLGEKATKQVETAPVMPTAPAAAAGTVVTPEVPAASVPPAPAAPTPTPVVPMAEPTPAPAPAAPAPEPSVVLPEAPVAPAPEPSVVLPEPPVAPATEPVAPVAAPQGVSDAQPTQPVAPAAPVAPAQ